MVRDQVRLQRRRGTVPIDGVSWLAAGIVADFDVALVELHCNVVIVSVVQEDAVILSCGHLERDRESKCFHKVG